MSHEPFRGFVPHKPKRLTQTRPCGQSQIPASGRCSGLRDGQTNGHQEEWRHRASKSSVNDNYRGGKTPPCRKCGVGNTVTAVTEPKDGICVKDGQWDGEGRERCRDPEKHKPMCTRRQTGRPDRHTLAPQQTPRTQDKQGTDGGRAQKLMSPCQKYRGPTTA